MLRHLFQGELNEQQYYSEYAGYVLISAILSDILLSHRVANYPAISVDLSQLDHALDTWQRLWQLDPKSRSTGPGSPFGAVAFNASAVYRATTNRRLKDYSTYTHFVRGFDLGSRLIYVWAMHLAFKRLWMS
jgi:hypothetical protein